MSEKLPKGWKRVKLGEKADVKNGKSNTVDATNNGLYVFFDRSREVKRINKFLFDTTAIIVPGEGKEFLPRYFEGKFDLHQRCYAIFNFKPDADPKFIYYFIYNSKKRFEIVAVGSTVMSLRLNHFLDFPLLLPPLPEQKAIASVLSSLDDKIGLLHRQNQTLEQMAQTLFRKWFIEDAKEDWEEVKLKDIYIFEKGFEPGSKNYLEEKEHNTIRFIRVGDLLDDKGSIFIKKDIAKVICNKNDLLMSFDGTVGRINFGLEGAFSSGIRKIYSDNPVFDNLGLKYLIFKSKDIQDLIKTHSSGTVILHASSSIDYLTFSFPKDEDYIKKFNELIDPIFNKILENKTQIRTLEKLRDTLLPKLMSGEIRIKDPN